jgi:hypothetical protein
MTNTNGKQSGPPWARHYHLSPNMGMTQFFGSYDDYLDRNAPRPLYCDIPIPPHRKCPDGDLGELIVILTRLLHPHHGHTQEHFELIDEILNRGIMTIDELSHYRAKLALDICLVYDTLSVDEQKKITMDWAVLRRVIASLTTVLEKNKLPKAAAAEDNKTQVF